MPSQEYRSDPRRRGTIRTGKWRARMRWQGKELHLGVFDTYEDAKRREEMQRIRREVRADNRRATR